MHNNQFRNKHLPLAEELYDAGHLVGDANLLRTFGQTFLTIGTATGPCLDVGQCQPQAIGELLFLVSIVGSALVGQGQNVTVHRLVVVGKVAWDIHAIVISLADGGSGHYR